MANTKEIQNRINSIQDTMKITRAMYMMSSMKLRKAKAQLENTEPYFFALQEQLKDVLYHFPTMQHLFFDNRDSDLKETVKRKAFLVITGDKGMAGAYNHNILKETKALIEASESYRLYVVGELGRHYFEGQKFNVIENFRYSASNPSIHRARVITENLILAYRNEEIDEVYVVYTKLSKGVKEEIEVSQLLPLKTSKFITEELLAEAKAGVGAYSVDDLENGRSDYLLYPSPKQVVETLVENYVTGFVYGALVESFASEENARMMAMQSATDNAEEILKELQVEFNRVRQAAITQEITEVIGGAKALRKKKAKKKKLSEKQRDALQSY